MLNLEEVAQRMGISRARVWQLEQQALRKIRQALIEDATDVDVPDRDNRNHGGAYGDDAVQS